MTRETGAQRRKRAMDRMTHFVEEWVTGGDIPSVEEVLNDVNAWFEDELHSQPYAYMPFDPQEETQEDMAAEVIENVTG